MFGEISSGPAINELRADRSAGSEPARRGGPGRLAAAAPSPQRSASPELVRRGRRQVLPIGILLYLVSIGVVATTTIGVLFGIGFALLVQPTDVLEGGATPGPGARSLLYDLIPKFFTTVAADTKAADTKVVVVPLRPEPLRSALLPALPSAPAVQAPAADPIPPSKLGGMMSASEVATVVGRTDTDNAGAGVEASRAEMARLTDAGAPIGVPADSPPRVGTPAATAAAPDAPTVDVAELLARGDGYLGKGDVTSARLFYERAADAGSRQAAMRLGATFDANFLDRAGFTGTRGDQARADMWYRRARGLGTAEAGGEPKRRETK